MDYSAAKFWFDVAQFVLTGLIGIYVWNSNRQRATKTAIDRVESQAKEDISMLDDRLDEHNDRLVSLERDMKHLPNIKDIGGVHHRVDQVAQAVKGVEGEMKQINNTMQLINQHLLEKN